MNCITSGGVIPVSQGGWPRYMIAYQILLDESHSISLGSSHQVSHGLRVDLTDGSVNFLPLFVKKDEGRCDQAVITTGYFLAIRSLNIDSHHQELTLQILLDPIHDGFGQGAAHSVRRLDFQKHRKSGSNLRKQASTLCGELLPGTQRQPQQDQQDQQPAQQQYILELHPIAQQEERSQD